MIKKDLKTLSEFQNPKKNVWRIHLEDGSFIDTTDETRDRTIFNLHRQGHFLHGSVNVTPLRVAEHINVSFNVTTTSERLSRGKRLWKSFKEDVLYWNKGLFMFLSFMSVIAGWLTYTAHYFVNSPIKNSNDVPMSYLEGGLYWVGMTYVFVMGFSQIRRVWNLIAYISCWIKFGAFIILAILLLLTVGMVNDETGEKMAGWIGKHIMTETEHKIMKIIFEGSTLDS